MNTPTIAQALRHATCELAAAAVPSPEVDARLLLGHVVGREHLELVLEAERLLTPHEQATFADLLRQRVARCPLQILLGEVEFYGRPFKVSPGVLIPRPETEVVVEAALAFLDVSSPLRAADIGSGAGVIGITLATERPLLTVSCVDRAPEAAALTLANAARLDVFARVQVLRGDGMAPLARGAFDLVVSNPPYLPRDLIATLEPEVRDHDPELALDGGPDGLAVIARLLADAGSVLKPEGHLVLEIGHDQAAAAARLAAMHGWRKVAFRPDLTGCDRVLLARRPLSEAPSEAAPAGW